MKKKTREKRVWQQPIRIRVWSREIKTSGKILDALGRGKPPPNATEAYLVCERHSWSPAVEAITRKQGCVREMRLANPSRTLRYNHITRTFSESPARHPSSKAYSVFSTLFSLPNTDSGAPSSYLFPIPFGNGILHAIMIHPAVHSLHQTKVQQKRSSQIFLLKSCVDARLA